MILYVKLFPTQGSKVAKTYIMYNIIMYINIFTYFRSYRVIYSVCIDIETTYVFRFSTIFVLLGFNELELLFKFDWVFSEELFRPVGYEWNGLYSI